jgi:hypothetical protein
LSNWKKLVVSGSQAHLASVTASNGVVITGSLITTGSNTLIGTTQLTGSLFITGSGDITGYLGLQSVADLAIPTDKSASYIYTSGSTNDLYFTQYNGAFTNTTRLRWLEGNMYTGLLHGGLITSASSTTFNVSSGSGIIVNLNASINTDPYPTIEFVNWPTYTSQTLTYRTSSIQTFLGIGSGGGITQQTQPFNSGEYNTKISLGTVLHQNLSTINGTITYPNTAYGYKQRTYDFIKAFGPLKLSGLTIVPSSSLGLTVGSGTAFADGRNYQVDPNSPSYITDTGTSVSKIFRYYQSGSGFVQDTNGGVGYTVIDPAKYNDNGTLTAVPGTGANRQWSLQRVFWYPNSVTKGIVVYYGNATYDSSTSAIANLPFETFNEVENTKQNAVYLGAIALRNDAVFTVPDRYVILPGGVFRSVGGQGGGGNIPTTRLTDLSDVNISGPTDSQAFVYDDINSQWINSSFISASISGNAATATTASYSVSSSYAVTSSFASSSPAVYDFGSFATPTDVGGGGNFGIVTDGDKGDITVTSSGSIWTIDNDAVTYAKIQNVTTSSVLLGRATTGAGNIEEIILGSGLTISGSTISAAGGGSAPQVQVDTITSSQTWTPPVWGKYFRVYIVGGGGGAGSGARQATSSGRGGGGGGAPAQGLWSEFTNTQITGSVSVTIGAGGTGGAGITTDTTNGNNGTPGGSTSFGSFITTYTANAGNGGTTSGGNRGSTMRLDGAFGWSNTYGGGNGNTGNGSSQNGISNQTISVSGNWGGGGGAGASGGSTTTSTGGSITDYWTAIYPSVQACTGGTDGGNGSDGVSFTHGYLTIGTPGGGGSYKTAQATGRGGDGSYGAGGGGGAASDNGFASGRGGNGGGGICIILSIG